jgi:hypothetical protein
VDFAGLPFVIARPEWVDERSRLALVDLWKVVNVSDFCRSASTG